MTQYDLKWQGPFELATIDAGGPSGGEYGAYVVTVKRPDGHYAHFAGETSRFQRRFMTHRDKYRRGGYWIHDASGSVPHLGRLTYCPLCIKNFSRAAADQWLRLLWVFAASMPGSSKVQRETVEAAIAYRFSAVPDDPCSAFFDHSTSYKHYRLKQAGTVVLNSDFGTDSIVGLGGKHTLIPGEKPT